MLTTVDDAIATHLWRAAHREVDLWRLLQWAMHHTMDLAISEALDTKPVSRALTAAASFDGLDAEQIADRLADSYQQSGANDFWDQFVDTTYVNQLEQYANDATGDALFDAGVVPNINYDLYDERTLRHIAAAPNRIRNNPDAVWERYVQPELIDGIRAGESIPDLAERVRRGVPETYNGRASTIARTETISATNSASERVGTQFGLGVKMWLATDDSRTRPEHIERNGTYPNEDGLWVVSDGSEMAYPGDPAGPAHEVISCRCTILWVPLRSRENSEAADAVTAERDELFAVVDSWIWSMTSLIDQPHEALIGSLYPVGTQMAMTRGLLPEGSPIPPGVPFSDYLNGTVSRWRMAKGDRPGPRNPDVIHESSVLKVPAVCASACEVAGDGLSPPKMSRVDADVDITEWLKREMKRRSMDLDELEDLAGGTSVDFDLDFMELFEDLDDRFGGSLDVTAIAGLQDVYDNYKTFDYRIINDALRAPDYPGPLDPADFAWDPETKRHLVRTLLAEHADDESKYKRSLSDFMAERFALSETQPDSDIAFGLLESLVVDVDHHQILQNTVHLDGALLDQILRASDAPLAKRLGDITDGSRHYDLDGFAEAFGDIGWDNLPLAEIDRALLRETVDDWLAKYDPETRAAFAAGDDVVDGLARALDADDGLSDLVGYGPEDVTDLNDVRFVLEQGLSNREDALIGYVTEDIFDDAYEKMARLRLGTAATDSDIIEMVAEHRDRFDDIQGGAEFGWDEVIDEGMLRRAFEDGYELAFDGDFEQFMDSTFPREFGRSRIADMLGPAYRARLYDWYLNEADPDGWPVYMFDGDEPGILWRGVDANAAFGVDSYEELERFIGRRVADPGAISTSYNPELSIDFAFKDRQVLPMLMEIEAPDGVRFTTGNEREWEFVLPPRTQFGIREIEIITDPDGNEFVVARVTALTSEQADLFPPLVSEIDQAAVASFDLSDLPYVSEPPGLAERLDSISDLVADLVTEASQGPGMDSFIDLSHKMRESMTVHRPGLRINQAELLAVLDEGRFRSQFETGTSGGLFDPDRRAQMEQTMLGYDIDTPAEMRPIYGYDLDGPNAGQAHMYGKLEVEIRQTEKPITMTAGDSLSMWEPVALDIDEVAGASFERLITAWVGDEYEWTRQIMSGNRTPSSARISPGYNELQFHGQLETGDIERVWIPVGDELDPPGSEDRGGFTKAMRDALIERLEEAGIKWSDLPED